MAIDSESYSENVRACAVRITESGAVAIGGLYDLTAVRFVRFAATITRNQHDAEDAVSSTLLKVVSNASKLAESRSPWPYLLQMVRNESLVVLRRKRRWSFAQGLVDLLPWNRVDHLEQEDSIRAVWTALRQLPTEQSEVVVLKVWEELTFAQIADVLGIPPATAASRYRYALVKLSYLLEGESVEGETVEVKHE